LARIYYKGWEGKTVKVTHNSQVTNGKEVLYKTFTGREGGRERLLCDSISAS